MIINNKLDKIFGPGGSSTGIFLMLGGGIMLYFSLWGAIVFLIGAFLAFSSTSTIIDIENKRIKHSNNLFGIIKTGQWITLDPSMRIGIKKSNRSWRSYSRNNLTLDINFIDYRIMLYNRNNKPVMPIMKLKTLDEAEDELLKLREELGLNRI